VDEVWRSRHGRRVTLRKEGVAEFSRLYESAWAEGRRHVAGTRMNLHQRAVIARAVTPEFAATLIARVRSSAANPSRWWRCRRIN